MVKVLTYDIPDYKIKLKIRQLQVMGKKIQGKLTPEVNKEELLIHILQGTNNTDGMYPMRQTALQVYVILMRHVDMCSG